MASARNSVVRRVSLAPSTGHERPAALENIQQWALVILLAWAPLPLGSARPWAWGLLGLLASALLLGAALGEVLWPTSIGDRRQLRWPLVMGLVLVGWVLLQCLPQSVPGWHHPLWDQAAQSLGPDVAPSISIDRAASLVGLFRLLTYASVFFLAWQIGRRPEGARLLIRAVLAIGTAYALYGLVEYASPTPTILWFRKWAYPDDLTATFVNRNSFATFAGLAVIAGLVSIAELLARSTDARSRTTLVVSVVETLLSRGKWALAAILLVGSALLLSHSRGGAMATLCGVFTFVALAMTAPSLRSAWRVPFGWVAGGGCLAGLLIAGAGVIQRGVESSIETDTRGEIFAGTLSAIRDNLFAGTGLGSFPFVFPMYQPVQLDASVDMAHNDYLQNMLELGVPAALLLFAIVGFLVLECFRGVRRRRRDALYPCAAVAASVLVAVHSCVDFSLQIPAVTVTYVAILGVGVAQSVSSRRAETEWRGGR